MLFGDLVGFTSLSEVRDTEEVRELLSHYFEESRRIIGRYGGTVEKFIGDAVMAVWGVPTAHEDDAERAVRAGLELVNAVTAIGEDEGVSGLAMRVGIVTGEVAVTIGATQQGMVAGDAVNTASRVQSAAEPGQVWVDETTRLLTSSAITYVDVGSHQLKGKVDPVPLWAVRAVVAAMRGAQRADGLEAPLIGRDRQLRLVKEVFHGAVDAQSPALLVVAGEPGVGKTRLAWEFEKYVDGLTARTYWHSGRCVAYGEGVAFFALAEAFRVRLQVLADAQEDETDLDENPVRWLERGMANLTSDPEERAWLQPRLGALLGAGSVGAFPREDLFAAWTTFLERVSSSKGRDTVALVIDDAQHADEGLLAFVEHLLAAGSFPCFVLLLTRPGLLEGHPSLATDRRAAVLHLPELSEDDMSSLLSGLVAGLPDKLRGQLIARSEGVPLFAVETVRSLIDRDMVVPRGGQYVVNEAASLDIESVGAPASLQALVAARLDSLSPDQRLVVDHASVLGMSFARDSIARLCESVSDLDGVLASLMRLQLLGQETSRLSADFGDYRFVQSVVRQVAYAMLSRRDRKSLHLAVVGQLEETEAASAEVAAIIAQHYLDAIEAVPSDPDIAALSSAAIEQLMRAAARARGLGAPNEAVAHLRAALDLTHDTSERAHIQVGIAEALLYAGRWQEAGDVGQEAMRTYDELGDEVQAGRAAAAYATSVHRLGDVERARNIAEPRWDALRAHPDAVREKYQLGEATRAIVQAQGEHPASLCEEILALAMRGGDEEQICSSLGTLAVAYFDTLPLVGRVLGEAAAARAREKHQPLALARSLAGLAAGYLEEDLDAAVDTAEEGLALAREIGHANWQGFAEVNLLIALAAQGAWTRIERDLMVSENRYDNALWSTWAAIDGTIATSRGQTWSPPAAEDIEGDAFDLNSMAWQLRTEGIALFLEGKPAEAIERTVQALEKLFEYSKVADDFPMMWQDAVELVLATNDDAALAKLLELARYGDDSDQSLSTGLRAHHARTQGLLAVRSGDLPTAEEAFRRAIAAYDAWHAHLYRIRTMVDLAALLHDSGHDDEALPMVDEARAFYEEMRADAWLADLEARVPPARPAYVAP